MNKKIEISNIETNKHLKKGIYNSIPKLAIHPRLKKSRYSRIFKINYLYYLLHLYVLF